jgi:dihydroorotase-like cyclic amidohydrolase
MFTALFPSNVTSEYDDSSSDCTSMLGAECVQTLTGLLYSTYGKGECDFRSLATVTSSSCGAIFGLSLSEGYGAFATRT